MQHAFFPATTGTERLLFVNLSAKLLHSPRSYPQVWAPQARIPETEMPAIEITGIAMSEIGITATGIGMVETVSIGMVETGIGTEVLAKLGY